MARSQRKKRQPIPAKPKPKQLLKAVPAMPTSSDIFAPSSQKKVLHVGCGRKDGTGLHNSFKNDAWQEIRLDIDPIVEPDVLADMTNMPEVPNDSVDAIWSSHNIEHIYDFQTPALFAEFFRVLKPGGYVFLNTPDMQKVAEFVAKGNMNRTLYESPNGPITPCDVIYGHGGSLAKGHMHMAHKTGYTAFSLRDKLLAAGFNNLTLQRNEINLWAMAYKVPIPKNGKPAVKIVEPNINDIMAKRDAIDQEPEIWKGFSLP